MQQVALGIKSILITALGCLLTGSHMQAKRAANWQLFAF